MVIIGFNKPSIYRAYFGVLGLLGVFFVFAGLFSLHSELVNNYNILLFNPIMFILIYFEIKNIKKWVLYSSFFSLICLLIYVLILINKPYLGIVTPLIITSGIGLGQLILKNKS